MKHSTRKGHKTHIIERSKVKQASIFATDDDLDMSKLDTVRIETTAAEKLDPAYKQALRIDADGILSAWGEQSEQFVEKATPVFTRIYAVLDGLKTLEDTFRAERIDPNADILTATLLNNLQLIVDQRVAHLIADFLYEDKAQMALLLEALIAPIAQRAPPKSAMPEALRGVLDKLAQEAERIDGTNPYGSSNRPTVGVKTSYSDV